MADRRETIAAPSTPAGESGIGIIRISGPEAFVIADRVLDRSIKDKPSHTIHYCHVMEEGQRLDEVLVTLMRAPRSYTGEDTAEINCHGNSYLLKRVLSVCLRAGAALAEPGEFTKRAFLNGRIDLSQAEAVMDLIRAQSESALKTAMSQLSGRLSGEIREIRSALLDEIAYIEAALDDPEHYDLEGYPEELKQRLTPLVSRLEQLIQSAAEGRVRKDGIDTVILGRPNAGKSSLLNLISGEDRAIVTEVAGTTRDILTEHIRMGEFSLNLTDTAGIRDSDDPVEKIGIARARKRAEDADLLLILLDGAEPLTDEDLSLIRGADGRPAVILVNKSDLPQKIDPEKLRQQTEHPVLSISALSGEGLRELEQEISRLFFSGEVSGGEAVCVTSLRHVESLEKALASCRLVLNSIESGLPEDFFSIDLSDACAALGEITGETVGEDVISRIFEKFCMGK